MPRAARSHNDRHGKPTPRPSSAARGYDARWRRFRVAYLAAHPMCVKCDEQGVIAPATVIDHKTPMESGGEQYAESNLQALCKMHHDSKTATQDGGFGRAKQCH